MAGKRKDDEPLSAADQVFRQTNRQGAPNVSASSDSGSPSDANRDSRSSYSPPPPPGPAPAAAPAGEQQPVGSMRGQGGSAAPPPPPPSSAYEGDTSKNWMGITGLVISLLCGVGLGLVFGIMGLRAANNGEANNRGISIAAIVISAVQAALVLMFIVFAVAAPSSSTGSSSGSAGSGSGTDNLINELTEATQEPTPQESLAVTADGVEYFETGWLLEGDCYLELGPSDTEFKVVDCADPHWGEVYSIQTVGYDIWPGADAMSAESDELCMDSQDASLIDEAFGDPYEYWYYSPTEQTFADGDREAWCVVAAPEGETKTGSLAVAAP